MIMKIFYADLNAVTKTTNKHNQWSIIGKKKKLFYISNCLKCEKQKKYIYLPCADHLVIYYLNYQDLNGYQKVKKTHPKKN